MALGDPRRWTPDVVAAAQRFYQGHLIKGVEFSYTGAVTHGLPTGGDSDESQSEPEDEPPDREFDFLTVTFPDPYAILTSQTCDVQEQPPPQQPWINVAPAYRLRGAERALPDFFHRLDPVGLPKGFWVADLRLEIPLEKTMLVGRKPIEGFADEEGYLDFAARLGRRRDRAALATPLVEAVARTLRRRMANSKSFGRECKAELITVRLNIEDGPRLAPAVVRVHVISRGEPTARLRAGFEKWWEAAYEECEAVGIVLLPLAFHDGTSMDVELYGRLVDLGVRS
jgi:hypothetical protein